MSVSRELRPAESFYAELPVFDSFARLTDPTTYSPLPGDWVLGLSDIVKSTAAIEAGGYKAINTAAAAVIAAVSNAIGDTAFPFVFGGDGACFALPDRLAQLGRDTLAGVAGSVEDELQMEMRTALVPVKEVRASGHDVRVARFAPSPNVSYAMFSGGGLSWAERQMKQGAFAIRRRPEIARPDLSGLSCRFSEIPAERGVVVSLIVVPGCAGEARFNDLVSSILALTEEAQAAGRPVPGSGPALKWPPAGLKLEAKASRAQGGSRLVTDLLVGLRTLGSHFLFKTGMRIGGFDPNRYRRELVENTDFRKFDDALRMTLDCTPELADRLEELLRSAQNAGLARYGIHRQDAALMTCFVPFPTRSDHVHFVDGAMGGYALAAQALKGAEQALESCSSSQASRTAEPA